ncbi:MAG TPA: hypothetical protein VHM00_09660 [Caldimonas sp.]|nr:hypothetical protein [Caldimonas sp.]HEX2541333.1 hypothetical protein [Caldimonas sp.]
MTVLFPTVGASSALQCGTLVLFERQFLSARSVASRRAAASRA